MDLSAVIEYINLVIDSLGSWGFIIIVLFGLTHPTFSAPTHIFALTLAIAVLGIPLGFTVLFLSNMVGILILQILACFVNRKTNYVLFEKRVTKEALKWVSSTPMWKHAIVIGAPLIPTYPIKIAIVLSDMGNKKIYMTLLWSYVTLFVGNAMIYFGIAGLINDIIPRYVSYPLLVLFVVWIYFGRYIFKNTNEQLEK